MSIVVVQAFKGDVGLFVKVQRLRFWRSYWDIGGGRLKLPGSKGQDLDDFRKMLLEGEK
jgi:hypothetical protein